MHQSSRYGKPGVMPSRLCAGGGQRALLRHKLIEFILNFTDKEGVKLDPASMGMPPGVPQDVRHVITFKAVGDNRTEMTVTEYGYTSE
jgi:hypothetical protein